MRIFTILSLAACSMAISIESQEPQYNFYADGRIKGLVGQTTKGLGKLLKSAYRDGGDLEERYLSFMTTLDEDQDLSDAETDVALEGLDKLKEAAKNLKNGENKVGMNGLANWFANYVSSPAGGEDGSLDIEEYRALAGKMGVQDDQI